ncbi:MAG: hypothetical protein QOE45_2796 [Frankiaceae bacterium]|jgi:hypothetical protein|nr:hypothetical protein [Frankiaceae bacterium]
MTTGVRVRYHEGSRPGHQDFPYALYLNTA